jgi:hypothetical protein
MCLFMFLFWYIAGFNSRLALFYSRLGFCKFPIRVTTGIGPQGLDLADHFPGETAAADGKSKNFPVQREKPGIAPPTGRSAISARQRMRPRVGAVAEPGETERRRINQGRIPGDHVGDELSGPGADPEAVAREARSDEETGEALDR